MNESRATLSSFVCPVCKEKKSLWDFRISWPMGGPPEYAAAGLTVEGASFYGCTACYEESDVALIEAERAHSVARGEYEMCLERLDRTEALVDRRRRREEGSPL